MSVLQKTIGSSFDNQAVIITWPNNFALGNLFQKKWKLTLAQKYMFMAAFKEQKLKKIKPRYYSTEWPNVLRCSETKSGMYIMEYY